ncbi:uncharacterized protein LOC135493041 isoform X6 [Lineus longissimus]|uniref:uncharacterized protein LOC135493041 isoform X6 n=1 Tax=Lineus longissimus TaxID=88925 RepID=UPI00315D9B8E
MEDHFDSLLDFGDSTGTSTTNGTATHDPNDPFSSPTKPVSDGALLDFSFDPFAQDVNGTSKSHDQNTNPFGDDPFGLNSAPNSNFEDGGFQSGDLLGGSLEAEFAASISTIKTAETTEVEFAQEENNHGEEIPESNDLLASQTNNVQELESPVTPGTEEPSEGFSEEAGDYREEQYEDLRNEYKEEQFEEYRTEPQETNQEDYRQEELSPEPQQEYQEPEQSYQEPEQEYREPEQEYREPEQEHREPEQEYREPEQEYHEREQEYQEPEPEYREEQQSPVDYHQEQEAQLQQDYREEHEVEHVDYQENAHQEYAKESRDHFEQQQDYEPEEPEQEPYSPVRDEDNFLGQIEEIERMATQASTPESPMSPVHEVSTPSSEGEVVTEQVATRVTEDGDTRTIVTETVKEVHEGGKTIIQTEVVTETHTENTIIGNDEQDTFIDYSSPRQSPAHNSRFGQQPRFPSTRPFVGATYTDEISPVLDVRFAAPPGQKKPRLSLTIKDANAPSKTDQKKSSSPAQKGAAVKPPKVGPKSPQASNSPGPPKMIPKKAKDAPPKATTQRSTVIPRSQSAPPSKTDGSAKGQLRSTNRPVSRGPSTSPARRASPSPLSRPSSAPPVQKPRASKPGPKNMATVRPSGKPIPIEERPAWKPAGVTEPDKERQPFIPPNYILNRPLRPGQQLAKSTPNLQYENESLLSKSTSMPNDIHTAHQMKSSGISNASSVASIPHSYRHPDESLPEQDYVTMSPVMSPLPPYAVDPQTCYGTEYKEQYFSKKSRSTPGTRHGSVPPYAMDSYDPFSDERPHYATVNDSWDGNRVTSPASSGPPFAVNPNEESSKTKRQKLPTGSCTPTEPAGLRTPQSEAPEDWFQTHVGQESPEQVTPPVNSVHAGVSSNPIQTPGEWAEPNPDWHQTPEDRAPSKVQTHMGPAGKPSGPTHSPADYWPQDPNEQSPTNQVKQNAVEWFHPNVDEDTLKPENVSQEPARLKQEPGVHIISHKDPYGPPQDHQDHFKSESDEPENVFPSLDSSTQNAFPTTMQQATYAQPSFDEKYMSDDSIDSAEREKENLQPTRIRTQENKIVPNTKAANVMSTPPLMAYAQTDGYQSDGSNMSDDSIDGSNQRVPSPRTKRRYKREESRESDSLDEPSDHEPENRKRVSWSCPEEIKEAPYEETEDSGIYSTSVKADNFFSAPSQFQDSGGGGSRNPAVVFTVDANPDAPSKFARRKMQPLKPKLSDKPIEDDSIVFGHHLDSDDSIGSRRSSRSSSRGSPRRSLGSSRDSLLSKGSTKGSRQSLGSSRDSLLSKGSTKGSSRDNLTSASSKESLNKVVPKKDYLRRKEKPRYLKNRAPANRKAPVKKALEKPGNQLNNRLSGSTGDLVAPKSNLQSAKKLSSSLSDISCQTEDGHTSEIGIQADPDEILAAFRAMKRFEYSETSPPMKDLTEKKKEVEKLNREPVQIRIESPSDLESVGSSGFYQVDGQEQAQEKLVNADQNLSESDYENEVGKYEQEPVEEDIAHEEKRTSEEGHIDFSPLDELDRSGNLPEFVDEDLLEEQRHEAKEIDIRNNFAELDEKDDAHQWKPIDEYLELVNEDKMEPEEVDIAARVSAELDAVDNDSELESVVEDLLEEEKREVEKIDISNNFAALDEVDAAHQWKPVDEHLEFVSEDRREPEEVDIAARVWATLDEIDAESELKSVDEEILTEEIKKPEEKDVMKIMNTVADEISREIVEDAVIASSAPKKESSNMEEFFDNLSSDDGKENDAREPIRARIATDRQDNDMLIARVTQVPDRPESPRPRGAIADIEISIDFDEERRRYDDTDSSEDEEAREREVVTIDPDLTTVTTENVPHIDVTLEHLGDTPTETDSDTATPAKQISYIDDVETGGSDSSDDEAEYVERGNEYASPWPAEEHRRLPKEKEFHLNEQLNLVEFEEQPLEETPASETILEKVPTNMSDVLLNFDDAKGSPPATPAGEGLLSEDMKWAILNDINADDEVSLVSHGKPMARELQPVNKERHRQEQPEPDVLHDWIRPQESAPKPFDPDRDRSPLKENISPAWTHQRRDPLKETYSPKKETWSPLKEPEDNWIIFQPENKSKSAETRATPPRSGSPLPQDYAQYRSKIPENFRKFMGEEKEIVIISKDENQVERKKPMVVIEQTKRTTTTTIVDERKKQTRWPSPPPDDSDREILINFAPADEEERAIPVMKAYPDVIYGTPQAPKSKSTLNQISKEKKRGSDSPGQERPVERKKQRRRAPVPHSFSSDSDDDYSIDTPKQTFSSGWTGREKKHPGVYRGESDQSERSTTSTLDLVDEDKAKWNAVFGNADEHDYIDAKTIQPQYATQVEKTPKPKMGQIRQNPDYQQYRNSMHFDLPPTKDSKYKPLEFQFDVKPMVIIDKTADKNKENLRRNKEFVINPNNVKNSGPSKVPVDQVDGEPFRYELHFHNDASSIDSDHLSDVDVTNYVDGRVDPDDYLQSDSTPDTYYTGAQKPTVYYVEHNGDPTAFPRIFRHPMTDMDSSMLSSESSSPTNSLRGKRLWTGVGKYSPSGARATHAMKIFVPDKQENEEEPQKMEPEENDIGYENEERRSSKSLIRAFEMEKQDYQPPKRVTKTETEKETKSAIFIAERQDIGLLPNQTGNENYVTTSEDDFVRTQQNESDIPESFSEEEDQSYHVETDQLLNFWNAKSGVSSGLPSVSERDHNVTVLGSDQNTCAVCAKRVYEMEKLIANHAVYHKTCFKCTKCKRTLGSCSDDFYLVKYNNVGNYSVNEGNLYCKPHFMELFRLRGHYEDRHKGQSKDTSPVNGTGNGTVSIDEGGDAPLPEVIRPSEDNREEEIQSLPSLRNIKSRFENRDDAPQKEVKQPGKIKVEWGASDMRQKEVSPSPPRDPEIFREQKVQTQEEVLVSYGGLTSIKSRYLESTSPVAPAQGPPPPKAIPRTEEPVQKAPSVSPPREVGVIRSDEPKDETEELPPQNITKGLLARFRDMESQSGNQASAPAPYNKRNVHAKSAPAPAAPASSGDWERIDRSGQGEKSKSSEKLRKTSRSDVMKDVHSPTGMESPVGDENRNRDEVKEEFPSSPIHLLASRYGTSVRASPKSSSQPAQKKTSKPIKTTPAPRTDLIEADLVRPEQPPEAGEFENQPQFRDDVIREDDDNETEHLPASGNLKSRLAVFKQMEATTGSQTSSPPPSFGNQYSSRQSPSRVNGNPGNSNTGEVLREGEANPEEELPQVGAAKSMREKFQSMQQTDDASANSGDKKAGHRFTPPRGSPEKQLPEVSSAEQPRLDNVTRSDDPLEEEPLPTQEILHTCLNRFRQMEEEAKIQKSREYSPGPRKSSIGNSFVTEFHEGQKSAPLKPPRHVASTGADHTVYNPAAPEGGEFENEPIVRDDVIRESDNFEVQELPQQGQARKLREQYLAKAH